jgi:hypothetical protein
MQESSLMVECGECMVFIDELFFDVGEGELAGCCICSVSGNS